MRCFISGAQVQKVPACGNMHSASFGKKYIFPFKIHQYLLILKGGNLR